MTFRRWRTEDGVVVSTPSSPAARADDPLIPRDFLCAIFTRAFLEACGDVRTELCLFSSSPPCKQPPASSVIRGRSFLQNLTPLDLRIVQCPKLLGTFWASGQIRE